MEGKFPMHHKLVVFRFHLSQELMSVCQLKFQSQEVVLK